MEFEGIQIILTQREAIGADDLIISILVIFERSVKITGSVNNF